MRAYDIIEAKRDGAVLSRAQIDFMVQGYVDGQIPDYQMAAFCMAVYFRGMTHLETAQLTDAMARSGDQVDLSALGDKTVDKHSTGEMCIRDRHAVDVKSAAGSGRRNCTTAVAHDSGSAGRKHVCIYAGLFRGLFWRKSDYCVSGQSGIGLSFTSRIYFAV